MQLPFPPSAVWDTHVLSGFLVAWLPQFQLSKRQLQVLGRGEAVRVWRRAMWPLQHRVLLPPPPLPPSSRALSTLRPDLR